MRATQSSRRAGAFTLVELLIVIAIIGILAALLLPVLGRTKSRAKKIECVANLKQTGLAFQLFAHDHGGRFPAHISTNDGGSLEFVAKGYQVQGVFYFAYEHFRPLAPELVTPKLLACPTDQQRWPATNFIQFDNHNLSYFIGLKADPALPTAVLAGDRNLGGKWDSATIMTIPDPDPSQNHWWLGAHLRKGNLLFADGHVEESTDTLLSAAETVTEDIVRPSLPPTFATGGGSGSSSSASTGSRRPVANNTPPGKSAAGSSTAPTARTAAAGFPAPTNSPAANRAPDQSSSGSTPMNSAPRAIRTQTSAEPAPATNGTDAHILTPEPEASAPVVDAPEPTYAESLKQAARESLDATSWLLWLILLILLLILLARWLDRRWRRRKMLKRLRR